MITKYRNYIFLDTYILFDYTLFIDVFLSSIRSIKKTNTIIFNDIHNLSTDRFLDKNGNLDNAKFDDVKDYLIIYAKNDIIHSFNMNDININSITTKSITCRDFYDILLNSTINHSSNIKSVKISISVSDNIINMTYNLEKNYI